MLEKPMLDKKIESERDHGEPAILEFFDLKLDESLTFKVVNIVSSEGSEKVIKIKKLETPSETNHDTLTDTCIITLEAYHGAKQFIREVGDQTISDYEAIRYNRINKELSKIGTLLEAQNTPEVNK